MLKELLAEFRESKIVRALLDERELKDRAACQVHVDRLASFTAERPPLVTQHTNRVGALMKKELDARAKLDAAVLARVAAEVEKAFALRKLDRQIEIEELAIRKSADERIAEAQRAMWRRYEGDRRKIRQGEERPTGELNMNTGRSAVRVYTNDAAIERLCAAIRSANVALEHLKLQNSDAVEGAIAAVLVPVSEAWATVGELTPVSAAAAASVA